MKKSLELKRQITELKNEMETLQANGHFEDAYNKIEDLKNLKKELTVAETLEQEEIENFVGNPVEPKNAEKVDPNVVFNKQVLGKPLTEAEENYVKNEAGSPGQIEHDDERGGYLVPEEQENILREFRRSEVALKDLVNVIPVNTLSGKFPVETKQTGKLINFEELTDINQSQITFAQQKWAVKDYGDIIPLSNTFLDDVEMKIMQYIGRQFTKKAVNTENEEILKVLKEITTANKVAGKSHDDIRTVLNVKLDPAIAKGAKILTNQSGFDYLDKIKDKNDRGILETSITDPSKKLYKGKEIVVVPDELLANGTKSAMPFYVGDLEQAINFYDRQGTEVAKSEHAGFTKNATLLRAIERFDVKEFDKEAVILVEITPETTTEA